MLTGIPREAAFTVGWFKFRNLSLQHAFGMKSLNLSNFGAELPIKSLLNLLGKCILFSHYCNEFFVGCCSFLLVTLLPVKRVSVRRASLVSGPNNKWFLRERDVSGFCGSRVQPGPVCDPAGGR